MEFEHPNIDNQINAPEITLALTSAKKSTEIISIEDGKSEMTISRNDCQNNSKSDYLPDFVQRSHSQLPDSNTSSPRRMYVENASESRYTNAQISVRVDQSYQNSQ